MTLPSTRNLRGKVSTGVAWLQWHRAARRLMGPTVLSGPFQGMKLGENTTGSHLPKRLGSYEAELHAVLNVMRPYERVIDVGCGEGWYVVGLALKWPGAEVFGFDSSGLAQTACQRNAELNGVSVTIGGQLDPADLAGLLRPDTLLIVDIEGAETTLLAGPVLSALDGVDVMVETHDFAAPGAKDLLLSRLRGREVSVLEQQSRDVHKYPGLQRLTTSQTRRALDESRPPGQSWLWSPATR